VSEQPKAGNAASEAQRPTQITIEDRHSGLAEWIGIVINAVLLAFVGYQANANRKQLVLMREEINQNKADGERHERAVKAAEDEAKAAQEEAKIAKEAFYIGQNPYFGIRGMTVRAIQGGGVLQVEMIFTNGGKTPAWRFEAQVWASIGDGPNSPNRWPLQQSNAAYADRFFPSGETRTINYWSIHRRLTNEEVLAIEQESQTLYIWGTLYFWNIRGERLSHDFTAIWNHKATRFTDWHV
jgi:hypothetical protein